jgi:nucleoside-diphosphate-sugar epimerase
VSESHSPPPAKSLVLLTGASGFVGRRVYPRLITAGHRVRRALQVPEGGPDEVHLPDMDANTNWSDALRGVDRVVHLAARVHQVHETSPNPEAEYRRINTEATIGLAHACAAANVHRLVFTSSILAMGSRSSRPLTEDDPCHPETPYARSKLEAERGLRAVAADTALEVVILRAPLVYGPDVRGNMERLIRLVRKGVPLPLGSVRNRRSFLFVDNFADAIVRCVDHPGAGNQTFLLSDGEDLSTADLTRRLAEISGRPARLWPFPPAVARVAGHLIGRSSDIGRLFDSLQADTSKAASLLGWQPPYTIDEGIRATFALPAPPPR